MRDLFRSFERQRVRYLLIGGQAAVLYGAAHFTSDIDLWVEPTARNVAALLRALAAVKARVHKLTPPLEPRYIRAGHGFHFVLPARGEGLVYLDVMGRPPRVGSFARALGRCRRFATPWGRLPVVAIPDLVELKKTNRPGDYEVISRLVRIELAGRARVDRRRLRWAIDNTFRAEDLLAIVRAYPAALRAPRIGSRTLDDLRRALHTDPAEPDLSRVASRIDVQLVNLLAAGRRYWTPRLRQLRELRSAARLLAEGSDVQDLLRGSRRERARTRSRSFRRPPNDRRRSNWRRPPP